MKPSLSVIIPAYQAASYLPQAVASVHDQGWDGPLELLVVDDGSTDGTGQLARSLGAQVLETPHLGAAAARNAGLRAASGDLIALLDADDLYAPGALAALYGALEAQEADAAFALAEDFISPELTPAQQAVLRPRTAAYGGMLAGCCLLRRSVFDRVGLFDETLTSGETVAWLLALRDAAVPTAQVSAVTLRRRLHLCNTGRLQRQQELTNYAAVLRRRRSQS